MLERVYDTLRGILFYELPKNAKGEAVIFDRPVSGFYIGEAGVKPNAISIVLKGASSPLKDISFGLQEFEHNVTIEISVGADNIETTERVTQEATRIILSILRKHRRIWVVDICPICEKFTLSPAHFTVDHNDILSPYATAVTNEFNTLWSETHPANLSAPTLPDSGKAAEAFIRMYNDVGAGTTITNLPTKAKNNILRMQADNVEPVRMLYDVLCNDNKSSDDATGKQLFRNGTIIISAKELVRQIYFGPDNVPTTAY
jgi:hypothetical protein